MSCVPAQFNRLLTSKARSILAGWSHTTESCWVPHGMWHNGRADLSTFLAAGGEPAGLFAVSCLPFSFMLNCVQKLT